ncbi:hypothetical protein LCGC14_1637160 [marine sediment metagenome]|uniref:DUF1737 domain-containing protein n=1 Tax=marine sediment metagenome TaxID=412755 RepID=A0A0F9I180_9ZZZZ
MKNYKILTAKSVDDLAEDVTIALNDGWELVDGVFLSESNFDNGERFNQAIIKTMVDRPGMLTEAAHPGHRIQ